MALGVEGPLGEEFIGQSGLGWLRGGDGCAFAVEAGFVPIPRALARATVADPTAPIRALTSKVAGTGWPSAPRIAARRGMVRVTWTWSPAVKAGAMAWVDQ